jgi:hypothetical protein
MYNVSVGDKLPDDGSIVASISKEGVTLKKDDKIRTLTITASL